MSVRHDSTQYDDLSTLRWFTLLIIVAMLVLLIRLFYLQIIAGPNNRLASLDNIIQTVTTPAPRGDIYDRSGRPLAKNVNTFALLYLPPADLSSYFLTQSELGLLQSLSPAEMDKLRQLDAKSFRGLRKEIGNALKPLGDLSAAKYKTWLLLPVQQTGVLRSGLDPQYAWAYALTLRQWNWLSQVQRNPAEILPGIVSYVRANGSEPYLHRKDGNGLKDILNLSNFLDVPYEDLMKRLKKESNRAFGYQPRPVYDELTRAQVVYLAEHAAQFDGMMIEQYAFRREYPLGPLASHLVGYTGVMSDRDASAFQGLGYGPQEYVGKEGVERNFEDLLHGTPGWRDIEVDRNRVYRRVMRQIKPTKGTDVYLTVDAQIQARVQQVMGEQPGAAIICCLKPGHEGEIIALASSPSFDPARFKDANYFNSLLTSNSRPLLNRTYRQAYPPGSTFKLVTSTAYLQTGTGKAGDSFHCPGYLDVGQTVKRRFWCHNHAGHGYVNVLSAIALSCDVAFYNMGRALDDPPTELKRFAQYFGYGAPTGIELPNEVAGIVPDAEYKKRHFMAIGYGPEKWYVGDTFNYSIGQGMLTASPLQVLWSTTLVATKGRWCPPRLTYAKTIDGRITPTEAPSSSRRPLNASVLSTVAQGMRQAVVSGTCRKLNFGGMMVCAKTGTAESGSHGQADHAWVTGFFPMDKPEYAFVVFVEHGGGSGEAAIPKAIELLKYLRDHDPVKDK